jgi:hypothetical protein
MLHVQMSRSETVYTSVLASAVGIETVPHRGDGRRVERFGAGHKLIRSVPVRGLYIEVE